MPKNIAFRDSLDASIARYQADHGSYPAKILVGQGSPEDVILASIIAQDGTTGYRYVSDDGDDLEVPVTQAVATEPPFNTPVVCGSDIDYKQVAQIYLSSADDAIQDACIPYERD